MVYVDRRSLFTAGLYSEDVYTYHNERNLKWSMWTGGLQSQVVFNTDWTVCKILISNLWKNI